MMPAQPRVRAVPATPRAVFDCMVFLQGAARRDSPAGACLVLAERKAVELCLSREIVREIRDVLTRESVQKRFPALTDDRVDAFLGALNGRARNVPEVTRTFGYPRDPKDEPYLNLAISVNADYLVSRDTDILDLADPSNPDGQRLRKHAPQLRIVEPSRFLSEVRALLSHHY